MYYLTDDNWIKLHVHLATAAGPNVATMLSKLHEWLEVNRKANKRAAFKEDCWWAFSTYADWQARDFPFWDVKTIQRAMKQGADLGLIITGNHNRSKSNRTLWYTIDYVALALFMELWQSSGRPQCGKRLDCQYRDFIDIWQRSRRILPVFMWTICPYGTRQNVQMDMDKLSASTENTKTNDNKKYAALFERLSDSDFQSLSKRDQRTALWAALCHVTGANPLTEPLGRGLRAKMLKAIMGAGLTVTPQFIYDAFEDEYGGSDYGHKLRDSDKVVSILSNYKAQEESESDWGTYGQL